MVPHVRDDSIQTEGELESDTTVTTAASQTSVARGLKGIVRGGLTKLGSTISVHLQGKTATPYTSTVSPPTITEEGELNIKPEKFSSPLGTTSIISEVADEDSVGELKSDAGRQSDSTVGQRKEG